MLPTSVLKARIDGARTLRGMKQEDLAKEFVAWGFRSGDIGKIERGEKPLGRGSRRALAEILQVPEEWFEEPELNLVPAPRDEILELLRAMYALLQDNHANLDRAVQVRSIGMKQLAAAIAELQESLASATEAVHEDVIQLRAASAGPQPPGDLGRLAEDSPPSGVDRRRGERRRGRDANGGTSG